MNIGLIREYKEPADRRVALSPEQCHKLMKHYPGTRIFLEPSPTRAYTDDQYSEQGVLVTEDLSHCELLLGIKEVPVEHLIPGKTYMFFSHTIKAQAYNRDLLRAILDKKIRLIDYEVLNRPEGGRILGFGKWAGVVGTYNAFLTWGNKTGRFELPPAYTTEGYEVCMKLLTFIHPGPLKIAFTGGGRVAGGVRETLEKMGISELSPAEFLIQEPTEPVFTHLNYKDLYKRTDGLEWDLNHFYINHKMYDSVFKPFTRCTDILINGMYWDKDMDPLFDKEDTAIDGFRISVIADISCDVDGGIPITVKATTIFDPNYGWSRSEQKMVDAYSDNSIEIMAVANLPTELPVEASAEFGSQMLRDIFPLLMHDPENDIIKRATITGFDGKLTEKFTYLWSFVDGE